MSTSSYTHLPDELELLAFFESEPTEFSLEDGLWCYSYSNTIHNLTLLFSVNIYEKSVQTVLQINKQEIQVVSSENANRILIEDEIMRVEFTGNTILEIRLRPYIHVRWSSLRCE